MQIPQLDGLSSAKAFTLSCAGPLCNALMIGLCAVFSRCFMFVPPAIFAFVRCNLLMLLFNLLPVLPLDGGRMLLALLCSVFDRARILRILLMLGRVLAVSLLIAGFYLSISGSFHISLITLGCYLLYAAAIEEKTGTSRYLAAFISRRIRLEKHGILPVQTLCVTSALPVFMLIEHLRSGAYHLITVLDENSQQPIGQLCETQLISSLLEKSHASIGEILRSGK